MAESQMTDIPHDPPTPHSPPHTSPQPPTTEVDRLLPPHERLRRFFLCVPILSLIVGGALLIVEVVVIVLVLGSPGTVGISEDIALTRTQRGLLGGISVVMLIEAVLLGIIDIGTEQRRARLVKTQRNLLIQQLNKLHSHRDVDSLKSLQQVGQLLEDQIIGAERVRLRLKPTQLTASFKQTAQQLKELNQELNHHTLKYMASLVFDLASFLWKWALALLVISNNWLSVGVAIAGGVVYPVVVFWQKAIKPSA